MWFLAMLGIVVLAGGGILYATGRSGPATVDVTEPVDGEPDGGMTTPMPEADPAAPGDEGEGEKVTQGLDVVEVEMVEFGYTPDTINLQAGIPVVLRFTNAGKLPHEAMVGDAHMQEEFAAADEHDDGTTDHHNADVMAVEVEPGGTRDLKVVIDEPGTWYVACHLPGHYEQGQIATLNVT